jgi:hypothetical protein
MAGSPTVCYRLPMLLELEQVRQIVEAAATEHLGKAHIDRVLVQVGLDSVGGDALLITIVPAARFVSKLTGELVLNVLVDIQHRLEKAGDSRFPIIEYATETELAANEEEHA